MIPAIGPDTAIIFRDDDQTIHYNAVADLTFIKSTSDLHVSGSVYAGKPSAYYLGTDRIMVSRYSWGGDDTNTWLGGAMGNNVQFINDTKRIVTGKQIGRAHV